MPTVDNGNYLWIQLFYSSLDKNGRAGFVMANSAADARGSELEIRKKLIESSAVDAVISVGSNFFYTVTLPVTLWFLDKGRKGTEREEQILFIDARDIYRQIDRAHRDFRPEQIEFLSNIVRLYRGEQSETVEGSAQLVADAFPEAAYRDVAGRCKVATLGEIEAQGWSLNPGRYVGMADRAPDEFEFAVRLEELNEQLQQLNAEAKGLEDLIAENFAKVLNMNP
jgi:type I restriction enzyme M protein